MKAEKFFPLQIIDNFFEDPKEVVNFANTLDFNTGSYGYWPGTRTFPLHEVNYNFFNSTLI